MNAQREYMVIRHRDLRRLQIAAGVGAIAATILMTLAIQLWRPIIFPPAAAVTDPRMEIACKLPRHEGQFTGFAVVNGKLTCWRM